MFACQGGFSCMKSVSLISALCDLAPLEMFNLRTSYRQHKCFSVQPSSLNSSSVAVPHLHTWRASHSVLAAAQVQTFPSARLNLNPTRRDYTDSRNNTKGHCKATQLHARWPTHSEPHQTCLQCLIFLMSFLRSSRSVKLFPVTGRPGLQDCEMFRIAHCLD
jgi:hypothetical protein